MFPENRVSRLTYIESTTTSLIDKMTQCGPVAFLIEYFTYYENISRILKKGNKFFECKQTLVIDKIYVFIPIYTTHKSAGGII